MTALSTLQLKKLAHPAREARKQFLAEQFLAAINGEDIGCAMEAYEWYARLIALCGQYAADPEIRDWFELEEQTLLRLAGH